MAAQDDGIAYFYENVAPVRDAHWRVGAVEFALDDDRAGIAYFYENV